MTGSGFKSLGRVNCNSALKDDNRNSNWLVAIPMKIQIITWLDRLGAADEATWSIRLVMAGSLLTLIYELGFLICDRKFVSLSHPLVLTLHGIIIGLYLAAVFMAIKVGEFLR